VQSVLNLFVDQPVQSPTTDPHWRPPETQVADQKAARTKLDQAMNKLRDERTTADIVAALIAEATDPNNLLLMFHGWTAWI
jgi:phosphatidylinositol kinase/protein kinase (PI-3  family)